MGDAIVLSAEEVAELLGRSRINGVIEGDEFIAIDMVTGRELGREKLLSR
jgi:hypothetical protein